MPRRTDPAISAYNNMDIENMPKEKQTVKSTALLGRPSKSSEGSMDFNNPTIRAAKQLEAIRKYRNEINDTTS